MKMLLQSKLSKENKKLYNSRNLCLIDQKKVRGYCKQ